MGPKTSVFLKCLHIISLQHGDVQDSTKILNGRQKSTQKMFEGAKTLKRKVRYYSHFTITFPTILRCAGDFF